MRSILHYTKTFKRSVLTGFVLIIILGSGAITSCSNASDSASWPEITRENKPWTRWWWLGNILEKQDIKILLESFSEAGLGGVEITPIYGVKGYEDQFIDYLSEEWMEMLEYTVAVADSLDLGVDMILGTGWPYGGPQVEPEFAASKLYIQKYQLAADMSLAEPVRINDPRQQDLAVLQDVFYFDNDNARVDITPLVNDGALSFIPSEDVEIYAVFCGKTRQKVKRSAPGGEGYTLDHYSKKAFEDYVKPYNRVMGPVKNSLNGIFNDSYELYGADYTPEFLEEFKARRGYDLLDYAPMLMEKPDSDTYYRVLSDYRETLADLLLEDFAVPWDQWCNNNTFQSRYQAHGSPGNLIDLYAAADIPECEIFGSPTYEIPGYRRDTNNVRKGDSNKMFLKFCSSAAHLQGNEIVSSESFTWLREHFKTSLSQAKPVAEDFMLSGVNHMFLHGSTYTPADDPWPGFKFYASVNFNPTNTIWHDAPALFGYIARCQSVLQKATTDNEVLLYWPIYDSYATTEPHSLLHQFSLHSVDEWMVGSSFYNIAVDLDEAGIGFDFISDLFIEKTEVSGEQLLVSGKATYSVLIVPDMQFIPLATMKKLIELKEAGATVIFAGIPESVPGLHQHAQRENELHGMMEDHKDMFADANVDRQLTDLGIMPEPALKDGLKILRKNMDGNTLYFVVNHTANEINKVVEFNAVASSAVFMDPLSGKIGTAEYHPAEKTTGVKIQLLPGETVFLLLQPKESRKQSWNYRGAEKEILPINNEWHIAFNEGGPEIPGPLTLNSLVSWTDFGPVYESFSGTATYTTSFSLDSLSDDIYLLDLGNVRESARVTLNGKLVGTVFSNPFTIDVSSALHPGNNELEIEVTNLAANRLRALENAGVEWKKFYEINMVNIQYERFDATQWNVEPSGLTSKVNLLTYTKE